MTVSGQFSLTLDTAEGQSLPAPVAGMLTRGSGYLLIGEDATFYDFS